MFVIGLMHALHKTSTIFIESRPDGVVILEEVGVVVISLLQHGVSTRVNGC